MSWTSKGYQKMKKILDSLDLKFIWDKIEVAQMKYIFL